MKNEVVFLDLNQGMIERASSTRRHNNVVEGASRREGFNQILLGLNRAE
jgi:hypothetical protein